MSRPALRDKSLDQLPAAFARYVEAEPTRSPSDPRDVMTNLVPFSECARRLGYDPEKVLGPTARARAIVQVAILVGLLFGVAACKEAYVGPPFASNSTDQAGIVRFVGTSGQVDFVIPPHSSVMINPPTTIGMVTGEWLFFDYCSSGVHSFVGPEQGTRFAFLKSGDNGSPNSIEVGNGDATPPPGISEVAATTTACQDVATP